jgi:hypothetical protein
MASLLLLLEAIIAYLSWAMAVYGQWEKMTAANWGMASLIWLHHMEQICLKK